MKKIFLIFMGLLVTLSLVGCETAGKFTPTYNKSDYVSLSDEEKQALISDIDLDASLDEVVQFAIGGEFKVDAKLGKQRLEITIKVDGDIYLKDADLIEDFILYAEISSLTFSTEVSGATLESNNSSVKLTVNKTFILVKDGDLYFNIDLSYVYDKNRVELKESGRIIDGFVDNFNEMKSNKDSIDFIEILPQVPSIDFTDLVEFDVYQNKNKTTLVQETSFRTMFGTVLESMIGLGSTEISELDNIHLKTIIEIKENKITGFSAYLNGAIKNLVISEYGDDFIISIEAKNLGIGANMSSKLPKLPDVSNYKVVSSLPELPSL